MESKKKKNCPEEPRGRTGIKTDTRESLLPFFFGFGRCVFCYAVGGLLFVLFCISLLYLCSPLIFNFTELLCFCMFPIHYTACFFLIQSKILLVSDLSPFTLI